MGSRLVSSAKPRAGWGLPTVRRGAVYLASGDDDDSKQANRQQSHRFLGQRPGKTRGPCRCNFT